METRSLNRRMVLAGLSLTVFVPSTAFGQANKVPRTHGKSSLQIVSYTTTEKPGTIVISNDELLLWRVLPGGRAERFEISVGREGFAWTGTTVVGHKKKWPEWRPPAEMRKRQPSLPSLVPSGPYNPLGARALYLYANGSDTLYRIHGTNSAGSVGSYETSGCFRMTNTDILYLYDKVNTGTKVVVY